MCLRQFFSALVVLTEPSIALGRACCEDLKGVLLVRPLTCGPFQGWSTVPISLSAWVQQGSLLRLQRLSTVLLS